MGGARRLGLAGLLLAGCSDAPLPITESGDPPYVAPAGSCDAADLEDLDRFPACSAFGGIFGEWLVDERGLPAYRYGLDEQADARAGFFNTTHTDRRDHWFALGNGRVTALAYNDGNVEVTTQDRGPSYLDKIDEANGAYGGGFSYLDDGVETWCSAYKWRPAHARTFRRFGLGWAEATTRYRGVELVRRTLAGPRDLPGVVDEIVLTNLDTTPRALRHYEYWDVARRPIEINWAVSGIPLSAAPRSAAEARDARNGLFDEAVSWDPAARILALRRTLAAGTQAPAPGQPNDVDYAPGDPFLAALTGDVADVYTEQASFFGGGGPSAPDAVTARSAGDGASSGPKGAPRSGLGQPRMLGLRTDLSLAPGESKRLRFVYGYAPMGAPIALDPSLSDASRDLAAAQATQAREHLFRFAADRDPVLHRELAWHAAELEAVAGHRDYWGRRVVPQGSAYFFLHGADGAARDLALFTIPLVYTDPALAKEELGMHMGLHRADDRRFSYAFQGQGQLDDALGLHENPCDLDVAFLFALSEYLGATGDLAFLDAPMSYWPNGAVKDATVWTHMHDAVRHLFDAIGTGEHGLIRLSTGDWSDGIALEAKDHALAVAKGESVPTTQMAVAVLPVVADLVEPRDAALAAEVRAKVKTFRAAAQATWTGSFFGRAYFGDGVLAYAKKLDLEAQVWALVGDTFQKPADRATLVSAIAEELDAPSPAGATLTAGGQVWPAISGLLTWGYARSDPERAWAHLVRNTLAAHALAYPEVWYGIWSAPDGLYGPSGDRPGQAWYSQVTPMTDFPVMNANADAMPLLAALRVAGVEVTAAGLRLDPRVPGRTFGMKTELLDLEQRPTTIRGVYRPLGPRALEIRAPSGTKLANAILDGAAAAIDPSGAFVTFAVTPSAKGSRFEVATTP